MRAAPPVASVRPGGAVITQRPAAAVTLVRAVGVMLDLAQPATQPRAPLEGGVERVQRVQPDLASLDVVEHGPDDPPDVPRA